MLTDHETPDRPGSSGPTVPWYPQRAPGWATSPSETEYEVYSRLRRGAMNPLYMDSRGEHDALCHNVCSGSVQRGLSAIRLRAFVLLARAVRPDSGKTLSR